MAALSLVPAVLLALVAAGALLRARRMAARYALLAEHTTDAVTRHAPDGTIAWASPTAHDVLGVALDAVRGRGLDALCRPEHLEPLQAAFTDAATGRPDVGVMFHAPDGTGWRPVEMTLRPVADRHGRVREIIASTRDITARVEAERVLRASQKLHRMVLDHLPDAVITVYDTELRIVALHGADLAARGVDRTAHVGRLLRDAAPQDAEILEPELVASLAGEERTFECEGAVSGRRYEVALVPYRDAAERPIGVISVTRDVTKRHQLEQRLRHLAEHDALTGLPNRRAFGDTLERHAAHTRRYGVGGAVMLVDLDNFKQINDTLGHAAGDQVITRAAEVLVGILRETDTVARLGGDEFAILLPWGDTAAAADTATRIVHGMRTAMQRWGVTASVGVAAFDEHPPGDPVMLLSAADHAMYAVKRRGRDGFEIAPAQPAVRHA